MFLGNDKLKKLTIVGGYYTKKHKASGGWRIDQRNTDLGVNEAYADMEYIKDAPNPNGDGTRYAKYKILGTNIYEYPVHIKNPIKGIIKRGQKQFDVVSGFGVHRHYKDGNGNDIKWLDYVDPKIKIVTSYGSTAYTGVNTGKHLPGTEPILPITYKKVNLQNTYQLKTLNTNPMNLRKEPSLTAESYGLIVVPGKTYDYSVVAEGGYVQGNGKSSHVWYNIAEGGYSGWVSQVWIQELLSPNVANEALQQENEAFKAKILALETKVSNSTVKAKDLVNTLES